MLLFQSIQVSFESDMWYSIFFTSLLSPDNSFLKTMQLKKGGIMAPKTGTNAFLPKNWIRILRPSINELRPKKDKGSSISLQLEAEVLKLQYWSKTILKTYLRRALSSTRSPTWFKISTILRCRTSASDGNCRQKLYQLMTQLLEY